MTEISPVEQLPTTVSQGNAIPINQIVRTPHVRTLYDHLDPIIWTPVFRQLDDHEPAAVRTRKHTHWKSLKPNGKCHACGALLNPMGKAPLSLRFCSLRCIGFHIQWMKNLAILDALGGKCNLCGNNDIRCLERHHKDPRTKHIQLYMTEKKSNLHLFELLCSNCHNIKTWDQQGYGMLATIIKQRLKSNGKR